MILHKYVHKLFLNDVLHFIGVGNICGKNAFANLRMQINCSEHLYISGR